MADEITVRDEGGSAPQPLHPAGSYVAVCVDVVGLGERVESYQNGPEKLTPKVSLVWQTGMPNPETGKRFEISKEFTIAFGETAGLRKFLGTWRGRKYTDEEARLGAPLHKLVGANALLLVEHKTSGKGNVYANVMAITPPLRDGSPKMAIESYTRGELWAKRKLEYAEAAEAWRKVHAIPLKPQRALATVLAENDEDDLPF